MNKPLIKPVIISSMTGSYQAQVQLVVHSLFCCTGLDIGRLQLDPLGPDLIGSWTKKNCLYRSFVVKFIVPNNPYNYLIYIISMDRDCNPL
jgi:hypothetical protein